MERFCSLWDLNLHAVDAVQKREAAYGLLELIRFKIKSDLGSLAKWTATLCFPSWDSFDDFEHQRLNLLIMLYIKPFKPRNLPPLAAISYGYTDKTIRSFLNTCNLNSKYIKSIELVGCQWNRTIYQHHTSVNEDNLWLDINRDTLSIDIKKESAVDGNVLLDVQYKSISTWRLHVQQNSVNVITLTMGLAKNALVLHFKQAKDIETLVARLRTKSIPEERTNKKYSVPKIELCVQKSDTISPPQLPDSELHNADSSGPPPLLSGSDESVVVKCADSSIDSKVFQNPREMSVAQGLQTSQLDKNLYDNTKLSAYKAQRLVTKTIKRYLRIRKKHFKSLQKFLVKRSGANLQSVGLPGELKVPSSAFSLNFKSIREEGINVDLGYWDSVIN